jgi:hypothetical protein
LNPNKHSAVKVEAQYPNLPGSKINTPQKDDFDEKMDEFDIEMRQSRAIDVKTKNEIPDKPVERRNPKSRAKWNKKDKGSPMIQYQNEGMHQMLIILDESSDFDDIRMLQK